MESGKEPSKNAKALISKLLSEYSSRVFADSGTIYKFRDSRRSFVSNDIVSMESHNDSYTSILKAYSDGLNSNIQFKNECKKWFFWLCFCVLVSICIALIGILVYISYMTFAYPHVAFSVSNIAAIVGSIGTAFVSSFIIIPRIITEYLFNLKEEKNMMEIIQNIQKHDLVIRKYIQENIDKQKPAD